MRSASPTLCSDVGPVAARRGTVAPLLGAVALLLAAAGPLRAEDAILVLDASGSMWGQIDGKTKVEIARAAVGALLDKIPAERRLGLVAYGHRREGDCNDIEEVVAVGSDSQAIRRAVNGLAFKGKTPLSASVRFAAERLKYREGKATVVLVSDGAETCNVDPCLLGRELEAAGVDFTAHIIGFGLASTTESAGLKCLAEATGGRYVAAANASELAAALAETVAAPVVAPPAEAPPTAHVTLRATDLDGGPEITSGLAWTIAGDDGKAVFTQADAGVIETDVAPGSYVVAVARASDGAKGESALDARAGVERTVTIPLETKLEASVTVTPSPAAAGAEVSVAWTGPNRRGDYVTIVKPGAGVTEYGDYKETHTGNPLAIEMPGEPGDYEMRYVLGAPQRVLAAVPVKATAIEASLTVPATAEAASDLEVAWTGPGYHGDWVTVVKPDAPVSAYQDYFDAHTADRVIEMPVEPGAYEIRYVLGGKRVLARAPITITDVAAMLEAPATVAAGAGFEVAWTGPGRHGDWLTIVKPDAPFSAYGSYWDAPRGSPAQLQAPKEPGAYELRYVLKGKRIIARRALEVTAAAQP